MPTPGSVLTAVAGETTAVTIDPRQGDLPRSAFPGVLPPVAARAIPGETEAGR
ncbi:MAG TPA: hypothetical protein VN520_32120 [Streptomyces sp.]|uniref:hypothetical protein n=1 Tax=Streptomyces sp. TaxID=1931 RepID=UPI002C9A9F50|nr:hypothetical protein [Streptomyces sp.]HWU10949.1 hypothetical protein [Streptomyces sp.]